MSDHSCECSGKAVLVLLRVLGERCPKTVEEIRKLLNEARVVTPLMNQLSKEGVDELTRLLESLTRGSEGGLAT